MTPPARLAPYDWSLYFVTDTAMCQAAGRTVAQTVAEAVAGGAGIVQIRDKDSSDAEVAQMTRDTVAALAAIGRTITPGGPAADPVSEPAAASAADPASGPAEAAGTETAGASGPDAASERPVAVFVDDRLEVVRTLREEGLDVHLHVGQEDSPVEEVREVLGMDPLVGLSARTPGQFSTAAALRDTTTGEALVDLLGVGPVYDTKTKEGAPAGFGPERITALVTIAAEMGLPAVTIGGITAERAPELREAPVLGICVVSAICTSSDPQAAARAIRTAYLGA
ncbi:thiamine phosphate synthase [Brevibacterium yomogidense]|uniref:thiamine phosphate synthase n=1 Tax=Brevibacterium yomogidense TaxID=946573 RepID=UPI0018E05038|nr:thiamine phosphate synthase [Brevibacterium yomogidense]